MRYLVNADYRRHYSWCILRRIRWKYGDRTTTLRCSRHLAKPREPRCAKSLRACRVRSEKCPVDWADRQDERSHPAPRAPKIQVPDDFSLCHEIPSAPEQQKLKNIGNVYAVLWVFPPIMYSNHMNVYLYLWLNICHIFSRWNCFVVPQFENSYLRNLELLKLWVWSSKMAHCKCRCVSEIQWKKDWTHKNPQRSRLDGMAKNFAMQGRTAQSTEILVGNLGHLTCWVCPFHACSVISQEVSSSTM